MLSEKKSLTDNFERNLTVANLFMKKIYLDNLNREKVKMNLDEAEGNISLIKIERLIYDDNESVAQKLISVYGSVRECVDSLVLFLVGKVSGVELYVGVRRKQGVKLVIARDTILGALQSNFQGSKFYVIRLEQTSALVQNAMTFDGTISENDAVVQSISMIPSLRGEEHAGDAFVQGIEKFIDSMHGKEYVLEVIASPVDKGNLELRKGAYEDIYSALSPFAKKSIQHSHNEGSTLSESLSRSISNSISTGVARSVGNNYSESASKNKGYNMGGSFLVSFGLNEGTSEGTSRGNSIQMTNQRQTQMAEGAVSGTSKALTEGRSESISLEYKDMSINNLLDQINENISRIQESASYGLWDCAIYLVAKTSCDAAVASGCLLSLLTGDRTRMEYPHVNVFRSVMGEAVVDYLKTFSQPGFSIQNADLPAELKDCRVTPAIMISGKELPLLINLPRKSVPGIQIQHMAEFGRNPKVLHTQYVPLGCVLHMGQTYARDRVSLESKSMTSHCFVTGATGCGKSNTVYRILEGLNKDDDSCWKPDGIKQSDKKIHFLVIEPAKGEYRRHFAEWTGINVFGTNANYGQVLKLNPFYFNYPHIHLLEHLDRLVEIFNNCWEMYAAMPAILKDAMERAYINKGWDSVTSEYTGIGLPSYPTFEDLLSELPKVINESGYSSDTKGDYTGALVTRVQSLTNGLYGQIFCDEFDVPEELLFDRDCIIDLSRVGSNETKSLIMGIVVLRLLEYRMSETCDMNMDLRHVTVLEEAHNLLKNSDKVTGTAGSQVVAKSVEMIVNGIAEMRSYGEGFIIVDQSPTSVDIAAIKNTNTKIVMRLPEMKDCEIVGRAVSLKDDQIRELSKLENGCAVVMQNNWNEAILSKIDRAKDSHDPGIERVSNRVLKEFRSVVVSALIDEYAYKKEHDVENVYRAISEFDITEPKKQEMRRYISQLVRRLDTRFNSILFGRTLRKLTGCTDMLHRCEKRLVRENPDNERSGYTEESLNRWYRELQVAVNNCVEMDENRTKNMLRYVVYAQQFDHGNHVHDYSELYRAYDRLM